LSYKNLGLNFRKGLGVFNIRLVKTIIIALICILVTSCGFQPLLTGQSDNPQHFTLKINGAGYSAYKFRKELEKQLALTPKINDRSYTIKILLSEGYVPVAYGADATVSRSQVQATATYEIRENNRPIATGSVTSYSSYILNYSEEFSTRSAQAAASERTLINLSEELTREIMLKIRMTPEVQNEIRINSTAGQDDNW
jgi:hypothetical protein